jgi:hypothetical protein
MHELFKYVIPVSVILTFIGTMLNIYYTRRNIETTKYIETITSERIKWLDIVRREVTNIIVNINFTLKIYSDDIQDIEKEMKNYDEDIDERFETQLRYFDAKTSNALCQEKAIWSQSDFIQYLYLFKLRLNPAENKSIIEIIDYFIQFYTESEYKSAKEISEARKKISFLIEYTQELLKQEWEKVKLESQGKKLKNKKTMA